MNNEIILKSGWLRIDREELDKLRRKMREIYESEGGNKKFNAHLPNYEELRDIIREKLDELEGEKNIKIKIHDLPDYEIIPGNTFFRNLFYINRDADELQFQEYNLEICYLFAYQQRRIEQRRSEKKLLEQGIIPLAKTDGINIIISSTVNNMTEAERLRQFLSSNFDLNIIQETVGSQSVSHGTISELYDNLDDNTYIFALISRDYLQNETCIRNLIDFTKNHLDTYVKHTFHILYSDIYQGDYNIFDSLGRSELLKYWKLRIEKLEENHKLLIRGKKDREFYFKLRSEFDEIKKIIEELHRVIDLIRDNKYKIYYELFFNRITNYNELKELLPGRKYITQIDDSLETTYKRIKIPSTNNPKKPEFPPTPFYTPKFPASQTYKIEVPGFKNVWLKDESTNPTGTHKDRMAWEVVIKYKSLIEGLKYKSQDSLPQMSIISSGSAAIAIQHLFNIFNIPTKLKVLVDNKLNSTIKQSIKSIGCELYEADLAERLLTSDDIKEITDNRNGIDITYREVLDPTHDNYYDWMSYEILKEKPEYCFIPFGTGDLYINVLNIVKIEYFNSFVSKHDPRFFSDVNHLKNCSFLGASTRNPRTKLDKLYSSFLPSLDSFNKYILELKNEYACVGEKTDIYYVDEYFAEKAIKLADNLKLKFEPSGMAGMALLLQMQKEIPKDSRILIVNTGKTKTIKELKDK
ncbi:MAG: pyridoxal-phosphate dependent enzyme [FCB group bacterium]|jgi:cysteine synthase